jgi:hypothetical protein
LLSPREMACGAVQVARASGAREGMHETRLWMYVGVS